GPEPGVHLPVRRMVPAELAAKLLPQEFLHPSAAPLAWLTVRLDSGPRLPRRFFLRRCDETFVAHPGQHEVAPLERAVVVGPWRERRGRTDETCDERSFRQRQRFRRPAEQ